MATAGYGPVNGGKLGRDDEDGLVDEWGVRYEGHHKPGGGTFSRQRRSRRKYLYLAAAAIVIFLVIVIIAVAVQKHSTPHHDHPSQQQSVFGKWQNNTKEGVTFYPVPSDGTVLIKYDSHKSGTKGYAPYVASLEQTLHDYKTVMEIGQQFADCTNNSAPVDKVCKFDVSVFKTCDEHHKYGYLTGNPCILLQLNLPRNETVTTFENTSQVAKDLGHRYKADHVGVSCDGLTAKDRKYMSVHDKAIPIVQYFPPEGFPAYWFRPRTIDQFLAPVVMVQFNTLRDATYIQIKCTAWAKSFNNGQPQNSTLYSTNFTIYHI